MKLPHPLQGPRITVRNYEVSDKDFCAGLWFDPENGHYLSDPTQAYVDDIYQAALDALQDSLLGYYLILEAEGTPVGTCCLFPDENQAVFDIGYCISKAHWRQGYCEEALNLILDWLRRQGIKAVTAEAADENLPSIALLKKLGFSQEKAVSFQKYRMNITYPSHIYRLILTK